MRIFVSIPEGQNRESFFDAANTARLNALGARWLSGPAQISTAALKEVLHETDILITGWDHPPLTEEVLEGSALKLVVHTAGSVAALCPPEVFVRGVRVLSANNYFADSVAEGVIAYLLCALRKMEPLTAALRQGRWIVPNEARTEGLLDQTIGLVSFGAISRRVIEMGKAFRLNFKVYSTRPDPALAEAMGFTYAGLDEIFSTCKIVSLHTASTPATVGLVDRRLLGLLQPDTILLNTARASVVDQDALLEYLQQNRFRAVLDVYPQEPLPAESPLLALANVTLFPHSAGPTYDRRPFIAARMLDDIDRYLAGQSVENEVLSDTARRMTVNL